MSSRLWDDEYGQHMTGVVHFNGRFYVPDSPRPGGVIALVGTFADYMADRAGLNTAAATGVPSSRVCSWCKGPRTAAVCAGCGGVTP